MRSAGDEGWLKPLAMVLPGSWANDREPLLLLSPRPKNATGYRAPRRRDVTVVQSSNAIYLAREAEVKNQDISVLVEYVHGIATQRADDSNRPKPIPKVRNTRAIL